MRTQTAAILIFLLAMIGGAMFHAPRVSAADNITASSNGTNSNFLYCKRSSEWFFKLDRNIHSSCRDAIEITEAEFNRLSGKPAESAAARNDTDSNLEFQDNLPGFEALGAQYVVIKNTNLRAEPSTDAKRVMILRRGSKVRVSGSVKKRSWYQITDRDEVIIGYAWAELLEPVVVHQVASTAPQEPKNTGPEKIYFVDWKPVNCGDVFWLKKKITLWSSPYSLDSLEIAPLDLAGTPLCAKQADWNKEWYLVSRGLIFLGYAEAPEFRSSIGEPNSENAFSAIVNLANERLQDWLAIESEAAHQNFISRRPNKPTPRT